MSSFAVPGGSSVNTATLISPGIGHRLSLTTATPITTSDVIGASTLYLTQYISNSIYLFSGGAWTAFQTNEVSLVLSGLTSGKNYDVFAFNSSGTAVALELSAAWASDSSRTDALTRQDGVLVKSANTSRRYVGTIRATGATTTEDSLVKRFVWNMYNRAQRALNRVDSTASWTFVSNGTWGQANSSTANRVEVVTGDAGSLVDLTVIALMKGSSNGDGVGVGIGEDSTTSNDNQCLGLVTVTESSLTFKQTSCHLSKQPSVGYHAYNWLEQCDHTSTTLGSRTQSANNVQIMSGINGRIET